MLPAGAELCLRDALAENMNGNSAMRETEASFWMVQNVLAWHAALRLAAVALGIGLVMAAGPVRAGDDDERTTRPSRKRSSKAS